ncbi:hypothetical protein PR202_ga16847 [Eleusine coracana subsp. coracana]|uniref:Reverse transcriptase zinc-binding domain-containing protein n=1 Tax=Eleusine coracana subsp. coracana TaxID=191504 RepID=A0AAV5CNN4_ELECO|nr:hypothetical protein PR202_ga16846 [Eleusine coracana subsp. coracana]GJM99720.1 hypothetical protein PR202_ga16847 [Eleusine coracana subsp. coracana]
MVPKRTASRRTVHDALHGMSWIRDIRGVATAEVISEFLNLCTIISGMELHQDTPDIHYWRLSGSRIYSAKSAYEALFQGFIGFEPWQRIWKSWAPAKCRFFMWLVAHDRCWTADRLARRNLPRPENCLLCDQEEETIDHILVGCVFARQFWRILLQRVGMAELAPQLSAERFQGWWSSVEAMVDNTARKGLNSLIILGAWTLWKHRNDCVFNGASLQLSTALNMAGEKIRWWELTRARALSSLTGREETLAGSNQ